MHAHPENPKHIGVSYHPNANETIQKLIVELCKYLEKNGASTIHCSPLFDPKLHRLAEQGAFDILVVLGGDGTMLRAGHLCAPLQLPILGINIGRFGFLTEVKDGQWFQAVQKIMHGKYRIEDRMMLHVEHWRENSLLNDWDALNELVVTRGYDVRPIQLQANVDGALLARYVADGLIIATPTGSTAYALAAGGPIMPPELRNILVIPVAPHLSADQAVILSENSQIEVTATSTHQVVLSIDGQSPIKFNDGDVIKAYKGENMVSFIRFQDPGYFYQNLMMYMERNPSAEKVE